MADDRIELQNKEFATLEVLTKQWRRVQMTPVVDDDYPEVRHGYEAALRDFLTACKKNGRKL